MKIDVTQEDINQGVRRACTKCPIAIAITRQTGLRAMVSPATILIVDARIEIITIETPSSAKTFIGLYDQFNLVEPFAFELML